MSLYKQRIKMHINIYMPYNHISKKRYVTDEIWIDSKSVFQ